MPVNITNLESTLSMDLEDIQRYSEQVAEEKTYFLEKIREWIRENLLTEWQALVKDIEEIFEMLVHGTFMQEYANLYRIILSWSRHGLTQTQAVVLFGQVRQIFIQIGSKYDARLAKSYCRIIDQLISLTVTIYQVEEEIEQIEYHKNNEVRRFERSFKVLGVPIPQYLVQPYLDHQSWLITFLKLAVQKISAEEVHLELDAHHCSLGQWLASGGLEHVPRQDRERFEQAHEKVHEIGRRAVEYSRQQQYELILACYHEMKVASQIVSEVLLNLIEDAFVKQAISDALTGLPNRRSFDLDFKKQLAFAKRHHFYLGLIVFDVDHFKQVNDQYGHMVGDQVLKKVAELLTKVVRTEERVYRWGGEEFAVLLVDASPKAAKQLAERVRQVIEDTLFCAETDHPMYKTVSAGAVSLCADLDLPEHEVFALADKLLYEAKESGRNRVVSRVVTELKEMGR